MKSTEILLKLVQGNEGKKWASKANRIGWKSTDVSEESGGTPVCQWSGIICNDSNDETIITEIDISNTILIGTIPPELGQLTSLRKLDLSLNLIRGSIPHGIEQLPNLEVLDLSENQLTGVFPKLESKVLRSLNLSYNRLVGTLHGDLGVAFPDMTDLDLMENQLTGHIPDSLVGMSSLAGLSLASNKLSGTIPNQIGNIASLRYLYLDSNNLVGLIPTSIAHEESILEELWLQNNLLSGTIPSQLSTLTKLVSFFIDGNKVTGSVPSDLCREDLNANFYQDVAPNIERNYCDSIACPSGKYSMKGIFPCFSCAYDDNATSLASEPPPSSNTYNPYLGKVGSECFDRNQRDILTKFFTATGGQSVWKHEENWDVEDSFLCTFSGITCDVNNHVIAIELSNMGLKGSIPQELGFLKYLQRLDLSGNQLTGFLPSDLRFAPLVFLDVSGNKLRGVVPPMLCLKAGINGNGNDGDYNCDHIACSPGTVNSETGRKSVGSTSGKCSPCPINNVDSSNLFIGSKTCPSPSLRNSIYSVSKDVEKDHAIEGFLLFAFLISAIAFFLYFTKQRKLTNGYDKNGGHRKRNSFGLLNEENRFVNLQPRRTSMPLIDQQNNRRRTSTEGDVTTQSHASHEEIVADDSFHNDQSTHSNASSATKKKRAKKKKLKRGSNESNRNMEERYEPEEELPSLPRPDTSTSLSVSGNSTMTGHGSNGSGSTEQQVDVWLDVPKLT